MEQGTLDVDVKTPYILKLDGVKYHCKDKEQAWDYIMRFQTWSSYWTVTDENGDCCEEFVPF